jgi:predicted  nucleic acid-binding Zn-ribbon protein
MKLATAAFVDKRIAQLAELTDSGVRDIDVVSRRLDKIRATETSPHLYGREETVQTSVLTEDQAAAFKSELQALKKQKQTLNDEILELNIKTEIPLGEHTLTTLTNEGLI